MLSQALTRACIKGLGGGRRTAVWSGDGMVRQLFNTMLIQHVLPMSLSSKMFCISKLADELV